MKEELKHFRAEGYDDGFEDGFNEMQEAIIKEINKLSGRIILGNYTKEGVLNLLIELKQRIKGEN